MDELLDFLVLKDEFIFNGTSEELNEKIRLHNNKKFKVEWLEPNRFKFLSKWSLGTLMVRGFSKATDGIKGYAKLRNHGASQTKVFLKTKVRIEVYITSVMSMIFLLAFPFMKEDNSYWHLIYLPFFPVWFWFVCRVQEKILFNSLKKYLLKQ